MEIVLAQPRGFCAGVEMAVNALDLALEKLGKPIYVFHEIVHNRTIVDRFIEKGAIFVDSVEEVPEGKFLMFSAHGVDPAVRQEAKKRNLIAFDATCPLVTKVHLEVLRFAKLGYSILLIGHKGHDEVVGTMGHAAESITIIETEKEALNFQNEKNARLAYVTQTTLSVDEAQRIIGILKKRFPEIQGPPKEDICYATQNRQDALRVLAKDCDLVVIVGSQNSSNSRRLQEIATELGKTALLIDSADQISEPPVRTAKKILLTAGASAPEDIVQGCAKRLQELCAAEIKEVVLKNEQVHFGLPKELLNLTKSTETNASHHIPRPNDTMRSPAP